MLHRLSKIIYQVDLSPPPLPPHSLTTFSVDIMFSKHKRQCAKPKPVFQVGADVRQRVKIF